MTRRSIRAAACAAALLACVPGTEDPVLATYDGGEVLESELAAYPARRRGTDATAEERLREIALLEDLAGAALARGVASDPVARLRLERFDDRPWAKALENRVRAETAPAEQEILDYIDARRDRLDKPRKMRLWNIFQRAPEAADDPVERERVRLRMKEIRERLLAGEDFNALARSESESVNRHRGGRMGAIPPGELKKEVEDVVFGLEVGETSPVLAVEGGFALLRNAGWVEAWTMSEEEAIRRVRAALARDAFEAAWEALRARLLEAGEVVFEDDLVAEATAETPIGRIGGETLTYGAIDGLARSVSPPAGGDDGRRLTDARIRAVFFELASTRLAAERAREEGLEPDASTMAVRDHLRNRYLAGLELDHRAGDAPIEVTDAEAAALFEEKPKLFDLPDRRHVRLIQLRLDGSDETLVRKTRLGRETVESIRAGRISFTDAAREISEHPSAAAGGDVGWKPRRWAAGLGPNVLHAIEQLEPGQITDLVRQDHLWILRIEAVEAGRRLTLEEALPDARRAVAARKRAARRTEVERAARGELESSFRIVALPEEADARDEEG